MHTVEGCKPYHALPVPHSKCNDPFLFQSTCCCPFHKVMACRRALVTGGGGYVGSSLCSKLAERGYTVTAFDLRYPEEDHSDDIHRIKGDIREKESLISAVKQHRPDVVFHLASYGMSGREMLNRQMIEEVNIRGTQNVIDACVECGVNRLVYTSTYNVVFAGQEIKNGDHLEILPDHKHVDHYSRTKAIAEQLVMGAGGMEIEGQGVGLKVCSLRCAGIYGEGERRHLPRIVGYIESGLFKFTYGANESLVDFLHGDNFCQAHIKAAEAMEDPASPVIGQEYYVSDGKPVNNFEFFRPLVEGLGYKFPAIRLPLSLIYFIAYLTELIHGIIGRYIYNFQPLLTRAEVYKTGVTHYFSIERARRDFGYEPEPKTLEGVVKWFRERGHGRLSKGNDDKAGKSSKLWTLFVNVLLAVVIFALIMSFIPIVN